MSGHSCSKISWSPGYLNSLSMIFYLTLSISFNVKDGLGEIYHMASCIMLTILAHSSYQWLKEVRGCY